MVNAIRTLVTGAGSGVGQAIVKALRASSLPVAVISSDIAPLNAALYRTDEALLLPKVEEEGSLEAIVAALRASAVDCVLVGSEFDVEFFSVNKEEIEGVTGARVVVSPPDTVRIADDKWLTAEFLRTHGLPSAEAHAPECEADAVAKAEEWGYPVVLKARRGTSSRHVHLVGDELELRKLLPTVPGPMVQRVIAPPSDAIGNEYTCSVFKTADGALLGPFTARRTLRGGSSWHIEVARFEAVCPVMTAIGRSLPMLGSLNVQLMVGEEGPVPFEFNARFSGTTAVRAHFGFNEPEMALRSFVLGEKISAPEIRSGVVLRYLEEVFIDGATVDDLAEPLPRGVVRPWF